MAKRLSRPTGMGTCGIGQCPGTEVHKRRAQTPGAMYVATPPNPREKSWPRAGRITSSGCGPRKPTQQLLQTLPAHTSPITTLTFSPDGKILGEWFGGRGAKTLADARRRDDPLPSGGGRCGSASALTRWRDDSAATADDGSVRIWLASAGHLIYTLRGNWGKVTALCFSHNGVDNDLRYSGWV